MRERKIEPKPVGNTHPNPVTSTPLGYNAQSAPKGEVEMRKVEMGRHRSLREWAAYPEFQETPLPEVGGIGAWQGIYTLWSTLLLG